MRKFLVAGVALLGMGVLAYGQGIYPGFPAATAVGDAYWWAADTQISGGSPPQTVGVTALQMKNYVLGGTAKGTATATGTGGTATATLNASRGRITTGNITGVAAQVITLVNSTVLPTSTVLAMVEGGANTVPVVVTKVVPGTGSMVLTLTANDGTTNLAGTVIFDFVVLN